ncbi:hypothetical protein QF028_004366 [Neobacillus sp. B4I6]|uniref:LPD38 domain-containing protein n=1 Tax=Neobacillus sp. B4I6 TaxID=3373925 RepID=UPI003D243E3E
MAFDDKYYKKVFESRYGKGSFDAGLSEAREIGRAKRRKEEAEQAAKQKKTYGDAVSYWSDPINKEQIKSVGAAKVIDNIRNDPAQQEMIKSQGFNVEDYLDGITNAASDGKFRSNREYNQYKTNLLAETKREDKEFKAKNGMSKQEYYDLIIKPKQDAAKKNKENKSLVPEIGSKKKKKDEPFLTDLKNFLTGKDTDGDGKPNGLFRALEIIDRPGDAIRTGIKEKVQGRGFWQGAKDGFLGNKDTSGEELNKTLGFDPKKNKTHRTIANEFGRLAINTFQPGGALLTTFLNDKQRDAVGDEASRMATEMALDPLNLIGTGIVSKSAKGLSKLDKLGEMISKAASRSKGSNNAEELLGLPAPQKALPAPKGNTPERYPSNYNYEEYGFKGESADTPDWVRGFNKEQDARVLGLPEPQKGLPEPQRRLMEPQGPKPTEKEFSEVTALKNDVLNPFDNTKTPSGKTTQAKPDPELNAAIQQQYEYLKNSMGKGVDSGLTTRDSGINGFGTASEVTGRYSVSNNPKWYQDFYALNKRKPNNAELRQLAEQHVREGFQDEFGNIPAWSPKKVREIDDQIDEILTTIRENPEQEPILRPILEALQEDKAIALNETAPSKTSTRAEKLRSQADALEREAQRLRGLTESETAGIVPGQPIQKGKNYSEPLRAREDKRQEALKQAEELKRQAEASEKHQARKEQRAGMSDSEKKVSKVEKDLKKAKSNLELALSGKSPALESFIPDLKKEVPRLEKRLAKLLGEQAPKKKEIPLVPEIRKVSGKADFKSKLLMDLDLHQGYLKTVTTKKRLDKMTKEELTTIRQQLASSKEMTKQIKEDLKKVDEFLVKLNLQTFGNAQKKSSVNNPVTDTQRQSQGNADSFRSKINDTPKKKESILKGLRTQFVDDVAPLENIEKLIAGKVGSAENSLYKQARLFKGSPEKAHMIVQEQMQPILRDLQANKTDIKDLRDYALAVHAKDVNSKGINSGFTNAEIDDVINRLGSESMETMRKKMVGVNNHVLDMLSSGENPVLSKEQVTAMREKWPNYMSLFRSFDDDKIEFAGGMNKAMANATNPIKKLEGSNRDVIDPMESMVKNIFKAVNAIEKNKVSAQVGKLAEKDVEGNFIRKLADNEDTSRVNVISVMDNGKKVKYEVPPEVYKTLMNLDKESTNTLVKILQKPASLLRAGATLTPEFSLRNPLRDVPNAFVVSESGFNPITDFPVGLWQSIFKGRTVKIGNKEFETPGKLYKEWVKENGGYGNLISMDRKLHQQTLKKALSEVNTNYIDVLDPKTYTTLMKKLANPIGVLRNIADVSESATKVGEFRAALRKGTTPQEAAYRARDIMDFGRAGISAREANKVVAFLNANIQGKSKLLRSFKERPAQFIGKAVAAVTIPTIGARVAQETYANEKQREIIDDAPQWLKDTFYLIPVPGTNQIARIPKPFDLAFAFSNTLERAMDYAFKNDKDAFDGWIKEGFSQASIPTMLTGIAPIIEGMANYSFFRKGPVIPKREEGMNFPDQYDVNTTETAKVLGKGINKVTGGQGAFKNFGSPRIIDNTIQGFTGGLGTYFTSAIDMFAKGGEGEPVRPEKSIDQMPVARAFLVNQSSSGESLDKLYNLKEKLTKARGSAKQNSKPFADEGKYKVVNNATKSIGNLNKQIRSIENSPDLSAQMKKARLDEFIRLRNDLSRQALKNIKNME